MKAPFLRFLRRSQVPCLSLSIVFLAAMVLSFTCTTAHAGFLWTTTLTGDSDSGISSDKTYTHAYSFGGAATDVTVNGVDFTAITSGTPSSSNFETTGFPHNYAATSDAHLVGELGKVTRNLVHGVVDATTDPTQSITLKNLEIGKSYTTTFYNISWGDVGGRELTIETSDSTQQYMFDQNYTSASGNYSGNMLKHSFTASDTSMTLTLTPTVTNNSLHLYGFTNEETLGGGTFSVTNFTSDMDSGVSAAKTYTHAYSIGGGTDLTVNGVTFTGVSGSGGNPSGTNFTTTGFDTALIGGYPSGNTSDNISGVMSTLTSEFCYSSPPDEDQVLTLTGLDIGTEYVLTFYSMSWDDGDRLLDVETSLGDTFIYSQNYNGNGTRGEGIGNLFTYSYTATDESMSIALSPVGDSTDGFHFYGFSNEVATAVPEPSTFALLLGTLVAMVAVGRMKK